MSGRARRPGALLRALAAFAFLAAPGGAVATAAPCRIAGVSRIVAVGDVHGAYQRFLDILRRAGVVDEAGAWAGGTARLVQLGDLVDRGRDTRRTLELVMRLESEAARAGGGVHALLGNHEVMNLTGDLRYVNPEEYRDYVTPDSEDRRERFLRSALSRAREAARVQGRTLDEAGFRSEFLERTPLGFVERTQAFSAEGRYGRWLRQHQTVVRLNGVVFVHGGLTPEVAALGCEGINAAVHREITSDLPTTLAGPSRTLAAGEDGPLWFRGLARAEEAAFLPSLQKVLQQMGARAIVVGHTVDKSGRIEQRFGGRVLTIDTGMADDYGAHAAALEIAGDGRMTAIYPGGSEPLARPAAAALGPGSGAGRALAAGCAADYISAVPLVAH